MFEKKSCRIDAKRRQSLGDAIVGIGQLEESHALCAIQASFFAAPASWIEHKLMPCPTSALSAC
jgi:hypothetical protein